jgi:hypothetical protein
MLYAGTSHNAVPQLPGFLQSLQRQQVLCAIQEPLRFTLHLAHVAAAAYTGSVGGDSEGFYTVYGTV